MEISKQANVVIFKDGRLTYNNRVILSGNNDSPILFLGSGKENLKMYRGHFKIKDYIESRIPLVIDKVENQKDTIIIAFKSQDTTYIKLAVSLDDEGRLIIKPILMDGKWNRLWLRLYANQDERIYGCGEQMSYFNLRGKHFPLWTSEPGVGRNKETLTTFWADVKDKAGGNYYTTNYPEPTFISTQKYYCHTTSYQYADFDFRNTNFHELHYWGIPDQVIFETADNYIDLVAKLTNLLGRQPVLPEWTDNGALLGVQGGSKRVEEITQRMLKKGVKLAGIWCQDWEGIRMTSFGKRLFWNWESNEELYPNLKEKIKAWKGKNLKFLAYINPYVANDTEMYKKADTMGFFAKNKAGNTYLVDFGEFYCGVVDFTNPQAFSWFKSIIKKNLIDIGVVGWMADFGEYLPTDIVLNDGSNPMVAHNEWPMLWAKCNYEAVKESGKLGEVVYFMRAGATGSQKYCTLLWAGDQSVNWSLDDGLASTIPAALSAGMTGNGLSHSDIGGYTSLYGNIRSKELFMRWAEMGSFLPFMRTHEGNRPSENFQVYDDDEAIDHFAKCTNVFVDLTEYRHKIIEENATKGTPVQRPLFMQYEKDDEAYEVQYEYLFGPDVLVAPVYEEGRTDWSVYLPNDEWIHLWSGKEYSGGEVNVDSPLGRIPVFYRKKSRFSDLFKSITKKYQ